MTLRERKILSYQGALTGIYDDFFDHSERKDKEVKKMMDDPFNYPAKEDRKSTRLNSSHSTCSR
jgi:hypothetical protein